MGARPMYPYVGSTKSAKSVKGRSSRGSVGSGKSSDSNKSKSSKKSGRSTRSKNSSGSKGSKRSHASSRRSNAGSIRSQQGAVTNNSGRQTTTVISPQYYSASLGFSPVHPPKFPDMMHNSRPAVITSGQQRTSVRRVATVPDRYKFHAMPSLTGSLCYYPPRELHKVDDGKRFKSTRDENESIERLAVQTVPDRYKFHARPVYRDSYHSWPPKVVGEENNAETFRSLKEQNQSVKRVAIDAIPDRYKFHATVKLSDVFGHRNTNIRDDENRTGRVFSSVASQWNSVRRLTIVPERHKFHSQVEGQSGSTTSLPSSLRGDEERLHKKFRNTYEQERSVKRLLLLPQRLRPPAEVEEDD